MSMPTITLEEVDFQEALQNVLASIALGEAGLAHILNATGMNIQHVIADADITIEELTAFNESVADIASGASDLDTAIKDKLLALIQFVEFPQDANDE